MFLVELEGLVACEMTHLQLSDEETATTHLLQYLTHLGERVRFYDSQSS